jgi:S-adenosyl-L-methionine hydrolase (adenosine-forming)
MLSVSNPPIITLTTDFGLTDHYVGVMQGVLLSRCPDAYLVDITHEIPPFSLYGGAYAIDQAAPYFPASTVHLVVIDPGVGTARKPLLVEALGQIFVAPDNGVLSLIAARDAKLRARELTNSELWLPNPSNTFHGRDIFAPVAAAIAAGTAQPFDVGPELENIQLLPDLEPVQQEEGVWRGRVISIDRFGNVITNFKAANFKTKFSLRIGSREVRKFRQTFGDSRGDAGETLCFTYAGSSGYLEIGMNRRSAAASLQVSPGDSIQLRDTII